LFLGDDLGKTGLKVMVQLGEDEFELDSPASVFIPSGKKHTYKVLKGKGTFVNHVLHGNYNDSLLEVDDVEEEEVKGQAVLSETCK
jgi:2-isopropylmalate synthase